MVLNYRGSYYTYLIDGKPFITWNCRKADLNYFVRVIITMSYTLTKTFVKL